jgi:hypothetical protein
MRRFPNDNSSYDDAAALARWIDEGGAVALVIDQTDQRGSKCAKAGEKVTVLQVTEDALNVGEEKALEYLGAAVAMRWRKIPAKLRRKLVKRATSFAELCRVPLKVAAALKHTLDASGETHGFKACEAYLEQERAAIEITPKRSCSLSEIISGRNAGEVRQGSAPKRYSRRPGRTSGMVSPLPTACRLVDEISSARRCENLLDASG